MSLSDCLWRYVFIFNAFGILPLKIADPRLNFVYVILTFAMSMSFLVAFPFFISLNLYYETESLEDMAKDLFLLVSLLVMQIKIFTLMWKRDLFRSMLGDIDSDIFKPKKDTYMRHIDNFNFTLGSKFLKVYVFHVTVGGLVLIIRPIMLSLISNDFNNEDLPIKSWYPLELESRYFKTVYVYQIMSIISSCAVNTSMDVTVYQVIGIVIGQLDVLHERLKDLAEDSDSKIVNENISECVEHYQAISRLCSNIDKLFGFPIFVQFTTSVIAMCLTAFQLSMVLPYGDTAVDFLLYCSYIFIVIMEIFFICWFGNEVIIKSSNLHFAMYQGDWQKLNQADKKSLIIFVESTKIPLNIRPGYYLVLSLDMFLTVAHSAYSLFTVMRTLNQD